MKKILISILALIIVTAHIATVNAAEYGRSFISTTTSATAPIMPKTTWKNAPIWASHFNATSSTATSTLPITQSYRSDYFMSTSSVSLVASLSDSAFNNFGWIKVYGKYAYGTSYGDVVGSSVLSIVDVSTPSVPKLIKKFTISSCSNAEDLEIVGRYAYVACFSTNTIKAIDVSNPSSPSVVSTLSDPSLSLPEFISINGAYAFVTNAGGNSLVVIDITNPTSMAVVDTYTDAQVNFPLFSVVSGKYLYMTNGGSNYMHVLDISNPLNITLASSLNIGFQNAGITINGRYLYVSEYTGGFPTSPTRMVIVDVANPSSPALLRTYTGDEFGAILTTQGNYLFATNFQTTFSVFNIASSTNPQLVTKLTNANIQASDDIFLKGNYAYVTDQFSETLNVISLSGITTPSISIGSAEAERLDVNDYINTQRLFAKSGISVGLGGIFNEGTTISSSTISNQFIGTSTATSTSRGGWNISGGCFAIAGACIGGSAGTNYWTNSGITTTLNTGSVTESGRFTATSSTASVFPYASTTALTVSGMASSTFFRASQIVQYGTGSTNYISGNSFRSQFYQDPTGNSAYIQFPNGNGEVTVNGRGGTTGNVLRITPASGQTGRSLRVDNNAGTEVVSILAASGNVGITTSAPRAPLSFGASLGEKIVLYEQGTQANSYNINIEAGVMRFNTPSSGASVFSSNGTTYLEVNSSGTITSPSGFTWQSNSFASPMTFNNLLRVNGTGHALPNVGIGTTSPYAKLSVVGPVVAEYFHATSTTATSTFSGHLVQGTNIVSSYLYPSFSYSTSTAWTGTTTIPLGVAFNGETWRAVKCFTDTGTLNVSINDGTNRMNMFNASTTVGNITLSTNNQFTSSEKRYVDIGTPASTPTKLSCTVQKTLDIE